MRSRLKGALSDYARCALLDLRHHMGDGCTVTASADRLTRCGAFDGRITEFWRGVFELEVRELVRVTPIGKCGVYTFVWLQSPIYLKAMADVARLLAHAQQAAREMK